MPITRMTAIAFSLCIAWASDACALKLASWNMEHLADTDGEGCRPRKPADYLALKRHAERLGADVIAVQEVENEQALARVFDPELWSFEIARNPDQESPRPCAGMADKTIITQRAGFAIRKPIKYSRNPDLKALDIGNSNRHRYGVDITLEAGAPLRLLSVHLKSGCPAGAPGSGEDCKVLFDQQKILKKWIDDRAKDAIPFALLGDFNRRLQAEEQFWTGIDAPDDPLKDLSITVKRDTPARCQPSFTQFIDYIIMNPASVVFLKNESFQELTYETGVTPASDHCPIAVELTVPDLGDLAPQKGLISTGLKWYRRSAEFPLITRFIYDEAGRRVDAIRATMSDMLNWVVSLDADETIFDNSLGQLENEYLGLGYVPERWTQWEARGTAKEVPGAIDFINHVLDSGGKIAVITNRDADFEEVARGNLVRLGMRDDRRKVCILGRRAMDTHAGNPDEWQRYDYKNDKDRRRRLISEGNAVGCWAHDADGSARASWNRPQQFVLWIGDNVLDLPKMTQGETRLKGTPGLVFGRDYFLLPNPLYGSWQGNAP